MAGLRLPVGSPTTDPEPALRGPLVSLTYPGSSVVRHLLKSPDSGVGAKTTGRRTALQDYRVISSGTVPFGAAVVLTTDCTAKSTATPPNA
jgi:hypothetical protein